MNLLWDPLNHLQISNSELAVVASAPPVEVVVDVDSDDLLAVFIELRHLGHRLALGRDVDTLLVILDLRSGASTRPSIDGLVFLFLAFALFLDNQCVEPACCDVGHTVEVGLLD